MIFVYFLLTLSIICCIFLSLVKIFQFATDPVEKQKRKQRTAIALAIVIFTSLILFKLNGTLFKFEYLDLSQLASFFAVLFTQYEAIIFLTENEK
jgi:hypothetical protein